MLGSLSYEELIGQAKSIETSANNIRNIISKYGDNLIDVSSFCDSLDSYVTPVKTKLTATRKDLIEQMIATAESYLGTEYVVGAAGKPGTGIDCSGLVMQALYSIGIDPAPVSVVRHTQPGYEYESRNLWNLKTLKTVSKPKRGDLVFYKNSSGVIIHVAIYLGNNRVIESWPEKVVNWPLIHSSRPLIKGYKRVLG